MDTPLETKHRYVVKRDGVSVTRGRHEMMHPPPNKTFHRGHSKGKPVWCSGLR